MSAQVNAGCFQILGVTPVPTTNSAGDNVGSYCCDSNGICTLIDSYFDASAPYTPIALDEEEIDVTPENPNAIAPGSNTNKSGAVTNDICLGGGGIGGGGGSGSVITVPTVFTGGPRREGTFTLRPFYRATGGGNGGAPNGGTGLRAARDKTKEANSILSCTADRELRGAAARSAIINAYGPQMNVNGVIFIAITAEVSATGAALSGHKETWMIDNHAGSIGTLLLRSDCPGGGSP